MRLFKILCLMIWSFIFTSSLYAKECFVISTNNQIIHSEGECEQRHPPFCSFNIAISLMGFDTGILIDEMNPIWDFEPGYVDWLDRWKQPHYPKLWLTNSCFWYSQVITKKLGMKQFADYIISFEYGNQNVLSHKGMDALTGCWLSGPLAISPLEQIDFINKLIDNRLPVTLEAQEKTKALMHLETLENGWELHGKTGNGDQLDPYGNKIKDRQAGWFVGFITKDEKIFTFVQLIADEEPQDTYASVRAKEALKNKIVSLVEAFSG